MSECPDADQKRLKAALDSLSEHFDAVQIFATRQESSLGGVVRCSEGVGNWYARYGQIRCWLLHQEALEARHDGDIN